MAGGKIADFFAEVGFKINTKELKKIQKPLKDFEKNLNSISKAADKAGKKIEKALSMSGFEKKEAQLKKKAQRTSKGTVAKTFDSESFFEREAVIRTGLKLTEKQNKELRERAKILEREGVSLAKGNALLKARTAEMLRGAQATKKYNFMLQRASSSARQLTSNLASAFVVAEFVSGVVTTGQALEGAAASMEAVTLNSEQLKRALEFVDKQSVRLGLNLANTSKDFVKLKAVTKGIKDEDIEEIFLGIAEAGVVFQKSADDQSGALRAVIQMFSKGKVQAEELRQQLAERLPGAMEAMEKATGMTGMQLNKALERGQLISKDILPAWGRELRKIANANGALNKNLETNKVSMNRMLTAWQKFMNLIFKTGFGKELTDLFNTITDLLGDLKGIGQVIGSMFAAVTKTIKSAVNIISIPLRIVNDLFIAIDEALGNTMSKTDKMGKEIMPQLISAMAGFAAILLVINRRLLLISAVVSGVMILITELIALTNKGVRGAIERNLLGGKDVGSFEEALAQTQIIQKISKKGEEVKMDAMMDAMSARGMSPMAAGAVVHIDTAIVQADNLDDMGDQLAARAAKSGI